MDSIPSQIYDKALESSMFEYDGGKMKMNMDLDLNGSSMINTKKYFYLSGYYKKSKENIDNAVNFYSYSRNDYIALSNCVLVEVEVMVLSGAIDGRLYYDLKIGKVIYGKPNVENIIRNIRDRWNTFNNFGKKITFCPNRPPNPHHKPDLFYIAFINRVSIESEGLTEAIVKVKFQKLES